MTAALAFRGPDAQGVWAEGGVGLGCALLRATFESRAESQPLAYDQVRIVADARIDARRELIAGLKSSGHPADGGLTQAREDAPDVELILHAYLAWGEQCVEHLLGDFAFIIWDERRRLLFCARDQYGIKQFYYAHVGNDLILSNTLDCLRLHPAVSSRVNERAIGDFLLTEYNQEPGTTTFFRDIQALPPAHTLTFQEGVLRHEKYWRVPESGHIRYRRPEEYVEHFREILLVAVADRLRTDRVGVTLSGGMDSSAVLALARAAAKGQPGPVDLRAYAFDYRRLVEHDDAEQARALSDHFGIRLQLWLPPEQSPFPIWDDPARRFPEPLNGIFNTHQVELMRAMAADTRVALNGHLADSALFPYRGYFVQLLRSGRFGQLAYDVGSFLYSHGRLPPLYFRTALRERAPNAGVWNDYPRWLDPAFEQRLNLRSRWREYVQNDEALDWTPPQRYARVMHQERLAYHAMLDPGFTGVPVEPRPPFADVRVANFVLAIPPVPWRIHKELLRRAMRGLLPDFIRLRPKSYTREFTSELLARSKFPLADALATTPAVADYVDIGLWRESVSGGSVPDLRTNLRPVALAAWLKRIEQARESPAVVAE